MIVDVDETGDAVMISEVEREELLFCVMVLIVGVWTNVSVWVTFFMVENTNVVDWTSDTGGMVTEGHSAEGVAVAASEVAVTSVIVVVTERYPS